MESKDTSAEMAQLCGYVGCALLPVSSFQLQSAAVRSYRDVCATISLAVSFGIVRSILLTPDEVLFFTFRQPTVCATGALNILSLPTDATCGLREISFPIEKDAMPRSAFANE